MPRGLDHIVHAVHDLDAARLLYQRLGFTVGARNRHPASWGTQNHIVQLPGFFIELLALDDPRGIVPHDTRAFSFGAFNRDFLANHEGWSMLALETANAAADAQAFGAAGIGDFAVFDFERSAHRPNGAVVTVGFSLAFARDKDAPDIGFFCSQQHHPENFWNSAFQVHPNTADRIVEAIIVAENPTDHHIFLSAFVGERELTATSSGVGVHTPRGNIQVMDPAAFRDRFGVAPPDISRGARLCGICLHVGDISAAAAVLKAAGIEDNARLGRLVVAPSDAMGAMIVFEGDQASSR